VVIREVVDDRANLGTRSRGSHMAKSGLPGSRVIFAGWPWIIIRRYRSGRAGAGMLYGVMMWMLEGQE
jgi:hypothetical protein